jgi:U3 small nucleolar RNA-associated protein 23
VRRKIEARTPTGHPSHEAATRTDGRPPDPFMRLKRVRRTRKIVSFFQSVHGFKPPFNVLVDGTAIQAAVNEGVKLDDALPKILGGKVRLLVPKAVVAELHALGRKFADAARIARRLRVLATESKSAADSIVALVSDGNMQRRFVMTADSDLRTRLAELRAVPLLRFARDSPIVLELPGGRSAEAHAAVVRAPEPVVRPAAGDNGAEGDAAATEREKLLAKKRKREKQPNPLSVKRKKPKPASAAVAGEQLAEAAMPKGSRRGKRRRAGGDRDSAAGSTHAYASSRGEE